MENKIKFIAISAAIATATILFFLGIRNIKLRKKNFFYTSLLIALTFLGCNFPQTNAKDQKNDDGQSNQLFGKDDPEFIRELNKTSEWKDFKKEWKSLDIIEPSVDYDSAIYSYSPYIRNKENDYERTYKEVTEIRNNLDSLTKELKVLTNKNLIDTLEVKLLNEICLARVEYLYYGFTSMLTRMIPAPGMLEKEKSIAGLEHRIDLLLKLNKKGAIDTVEFNKAMDNIDKETRKFSILEIISKKFYKYYPYDYSYRKFDESKKDTLNILDRSVIDFETSYKEFMGKYDAKSNDQVQKDLYNAYVTSKTELDWFMKNEQHFYAIIKDLIAND
jgi:hypothetical protein